jgi:hypothetical protein
MIKRNLKPALAFITVCLIGAVLIFLVDNSCFAISQYRWTVVLGIGSILSSLLRITLIFTAGIILFLIIKRKIRPEKYNRVKLLYFSIFPIFIFYNQILLIFKGIMNRPMEKSICNKSSSNVMTTQSKILNLNEYDYLKSKLFLLPDLPKTSDSINISYYHDDFLGDFSLNLNFVCENKELIDTADKRWTISKIGYKNSIYYFDSRN